MPQARRKLPIGIQTFAQMVGGDYYYVDKTPFAHRLIEQGKYYFVAGITVTTGWVKRFITPLICCCSSPNVSSGPGGLKPGRRPF